ncbi:MAG TPA: hypothetical protein VM364_02570 [Vicinamibacterales bacterium]|nr:hypothetical protein [Vicinamibacterales bacterium]
MKRIWTLAAVAFVIGLLPLLGRRTTSGAPEPQPASASMVVAAQPAPDVRVEHQLITVDVIAESASRPTPPPPARAAATAAGARQPEPAERRLVDRARRVILGDGRHRPEPFPRVKDND